MLEPRRAMDMAGREPHDRRHTDHCGKKASGARGGMACLNRFVSLFDSCLGHSIVLLDRLFRCCGDRNVVQLCFRMPRLL